MTPKMETITRTLSLLTVFLVLAHHRTAAQQSKGKDLIDKVCKKTPTVDLCVKVLSSDPSSARANLQDLTMISLKVASANASSILTDVKMMIDDDSLDPALQQGLAECKATLLDAEGQLEDTVAAVLADAKRDAQLWLHAALAAIDTCDASIPGDDDVLSRKSVGFRELCNVVVSINKALDDGV